MVLEDAEPLKKDSICFNCFCLGVKSIPEASLREDSSSLINFAFSVGLNFKTSNSDWIEADLFPKSVYNVSMDSE